VEGSVPLTALGSMTRLAEDGCLLGPEPADEICLSTTDPASPNNIPLSTPTTTNGRLRANGPPGSADEICLSMTDPASPNNISLSTPTTTNGCLRANGPPGSAEKGHGLVTVPASLLERHSDGVTMISSDQNECMLAPMNSMNETCLATTLSAERRPAKE
jgi:hypothetical protein